MLESLKGAGVRAHFSWCVARCATGFRREVPVLRFVVAWVFLCSFAAVALAEETEKTWEGTWTNQRYNTTGPLKCVGQPEKDGSWKATFSGKFQGRPFSYDVTFKAKPGKGQEALSGTATVNGFKYQWTGVLKGDKLTGRYRANNGYYGTFTLKSSAKE
jgi:hypothetical protein